MLEMNESTSSIVLMNSSLNHSGLARDTNLYVEKHTQTESIHVDQPKIRRIRDCTNNVKLACVNVSVNCNLSTEMSRVAVQSVCRTLYNHDYYLSKEEVIEKDPSLATYRKQETNPRPNKWQKRAMPKNKTPSSQEDY